MWYPTDNESVSSYGSCTSGVSSNSSESSYVTSPYSVVDLVTDKVCAVDVSLDEASSSSEFSEDECYVVDSGGTASIIDSTNAILEFSQIDRLTCHNGEDMEQLQNSEKFCLKNSTKGCCKRVSNTVRSVTNVTYDLDTKNSSQTYCHGSTSCSPTKKRERRPYGESCVRTSSVHFRRFDYVRAPPVLTAIHVPEAHNLPRYTPEGNKQDFMRWSDSAGELVLYKVRDVASSLTSAPLGCTYDSALDTFVFTLDDSILFASSHGKVLKDLTIRGFQKPSAVCIIQPGAAMAILDHSKLYLYETRLGRLSVIASNLNGCHRALTYTNNGNLVTVGRNGTELFLTVFDATEYNKVITSCPYPYPDNVLFAVDRRPCFADSVGNQMFFTDLRANTLTCMEFTGSRLEKVYSRRKQLLPVNSGTTELERFMFMSGIRCDGSGHLLIADARARMLKLFTSSGQLLKCARLACGASFPYCSSFGISSSGFLMACDRANCRMVLYRFGFGDETASKGGSIDGDVFLDIMNKRGVEN